MPSPWEHRVPRRKVRAAQGAVPLVTGGFLRATEGRRSSATENDLPVPQAQVRVKIPYVGDVMAVRLSRGKPHGLQCQIGWRSP